MSCVDMMSVFLIFHCSRTMLMRVQVFLNIVLDEAVEEKDGGEKIKLGMVVRITFTED